MRITAPAPPKPKQSNNRRQEAVLNVAAQRMGYASWRKMYSAFYRAMYPKGQILSEREIKHALEKLLNAMRRHVMENQIQGYPLPSRDLLKISQDYPRQKPGRKGKKS